ncbi:MAG: glycosyltransferase family 2 protein [Thermodesulfovibrionales bacterium]
MAKISAAILARNEERNIEHCLQTLRWCDEIVVVDMESEDRTVEIAKKYTDNIYHHEKIPAFDIAKKLCVEKTTGDWVLLIDADEMVPPPLALLLRDTAEKDEADIALVPFRHYLLGECVRHAGWGYTPMPRFFRKGAIAFTETIHAYQHVVEGARQVLLPCRDENCIVHFNYRDSFHFVEKLNRYTGVEAQHLFEKQARFSYGALLKAGAREFWARYYTLKGYKEGERGFSLSLMMFFYRVLSHIKLWEMQEFHHDPVEARYERLRQEILQQWDAK